MRKYFLQCGSFVFRAILLAGVLAGLLFSSGEGIRLLPFPVSENSSRPGETNSEWKTAEETVHQKNVHRFESKHESYQLKLQRDGHQHSTNHYEAPGASPKFVFSGWSKTSFAVNFQYFKSRLFPSPSGSRAPPLFFLS